MGHIKNMTDFEAIKKMSESKAFNGRFGKSHNAQGQALRSHTRSMGRWQIDQKATPDDGPLTFNWSKRYIPK